MVNEDVLKGRIQDIRSQRARLHSEELALCSALPPVVALFQIPLPYKEGDPLNVHLPPSTTWELRKMAEQR